MTLEDKLLVHLETIVTWAGDPLTAKQISALCDAATESQRCQAVALSISHRPLTLADELPAAYKWALKARKPGEDAVSVPHRGATPLHRILVALRKLRGMFG